MVVPARASNSKEMEARLSELLEPVVRSEGLMLVELQWRPEGSGQVLRLFIDRPEGGVTLDECAIVNRQAGDLLDVEDLIPGRYRLEVSSPGLTRRLRSRRDFEIFAGRPVRLIYLDQEGKSRTIKGVLKGCQGQDVLVEAEGVKRAIALDKVAKANLELEA
ncbi:MAG: ribosome maturation factor RimP [Pseudomonadota bacterium]